LDVGVALLPRLGRFRRAFGPKIDAKRFGGGGREMPPRPFVKGKYGSGDVGGEGAMKVPTGESGSPKNFGANPLVIPGSTILNVAEGAGRVLGTGGNLKPEPTWSLLTLRTQSASDYLSKLSIYLCNTYRNDSFLASISVKLPLGTLNLLADKSD